MLEKVQENTILDYEAFRDRILMELQRLLPENTQLEMRNVPKNNGQVLEALVIMDFGNGIYPTIYLQYYYERYKNTGDLALAAEEIMETYRRARVTSAIDLSFLSDFDRVKGSITYRLISREKNALMLEGVPHIPYLDLAIVFSCVLRIREGMVTSFMVRDSHAHAWETDAQTLLSLAQENTPRIFPFYLKPLIHMLEEDFQMAAFSEEDIPAAPFFAPHLSLNDFQPPMYVLTNIQKTGGACCILYPELLERFADQTGSDLYILPSSIHEVLLLPTDVLDRSILVSMLQDGNRTLVSKEDYLSDQVYYYDYCEKRLYA